MTPEEIADATGLVYCGPECDCGQNSGLMYFPVAGHAKPRVPEWMNGVPPEDVEQWLIENAIEFERTTCP